MDTSRQLAVRVGILVITGFGWLSASTASDVGKTIDDSLRPLLHRYCLECHCSDHAEGNIDLQHLMTQQPMVRHRKTWLRIAQLVELRSMPPEGVEQPTARQRRTLTRQVKQALDDFDYSRVKHPGFEPIRRLSHREYNNTLRDLLGVDLQPADRFPRELSGETGFDNAADTLTLQPSLMERYIAAAERVVDAAIPLTAEPPTARSTQRLLFGGIDVQNLDDEQAKIALRRLLMRAYRRPPSEPDVDHIVASYDQARATGQSPLAAFKQVLPSILIAPHFLLRIEASAEAGTAKPIDDWELASRLSYFLWSSMPDEELLQLASAKALNKSDTLQEQVHRMLHDPKAEAFFASFVGQWLSTRLLGREIRRDPIDEPWCTDTLMDAMREETQLLFMAVVRENRPLTELFTADYTFVNQELADVLYDIDGVEGSSLQRVSLTDHDRRGLLGHAAVLAVTANYDEVSPIKRGAYVLETLLGTPPPPPPPEVAELDETLEENDRLTFAQKLQRHADDRRCAACHQTIDPLGIALENYGSFGRYFGDSDNSPPATLQSGHEIRGLQGLNDYLLSSRRDDVVRNLTIRMLEYALGRPVEYYDEVAIRKIIADAKANELKMYSLIKGVITSHPFQFRQAGP